MAARELVEYVLNLGGNLAEKAGVTSSAITGMANAAMVGVKAVAAAGTAAVAAAGAYAALADQVFSVVDQVGDLAAGAGLSVDTINGLRLAARSTSGELEELVPKDLAKKMVEAAEGGKSASEAFDRVGVSVADATGGLRSADEVFREALGNILAIPDPTERAAAAVEVFGKQGKALLGTFGDISEFDRFVETSTKFGIQVGPEAVEASNAWWAAVGNLKLAFEDAGAILVDDLGGGATQVINLAATGIVFLTTLVDRWFDAIVDIAGDAAELIGGNFSRIYDLVTGNLSFGDFLAQSAAAVQKYASEAGDYLGDLGAMWGEATDRAKEFYDLTQLPPTGSTSSGGGRGGGGGAGSSSSGKPDGWEEYENTSIPALEAQLKANQAAAEANTAAVEQAPEKTAEKTAEAVASAVAEVNIGAQAAGAFTTAMSGGVAGIIGMAIGGPAGAAIAQAFDLIREGTLDDMVTGLVGQVEQFLNNAPEVLGDLVSESIPAILAALPRILGDLHSIGPQLLAAFIEGIPELVGAFIEQVPQIAISIATAFIDAWAQLFSADFWVGVGEQLAKSISEAVASVLNVFKDSEGHVLGTDLKAAKGEKKLFGITLPFFDEGTPRITQTGLAVVHKNEEIRQAGRGGGMGGLTIHFNGPVYGEREIVRALRQMLGTHGLGEQLTALVS